MAKCSLCGADTMLHVNDVPFCTDCDGKKTEGNPRLNVIEPQKRRAQPEDGFADFYWETTG